MKNYTRQGFAKIRAPPELWSLVESFWNINGLPPAESSNPNWELEGWDDGESLINHWTSPTYFVSLSNSTLAGGGPGLEDAIWKTSKSTLEAWTGQRLKGCSLYGVRVYTSESVLHTHVDRVPLISSAILNVGQDTDEPWPLEVIGHDGQARNITMVPGDMVLYESHTILHGRPFPLKGRYMANIFVHFEVLSDQDEDNQPFPNLEYERVTSEDYQAIVKEHNRHWGKQRNNVSTRLHHLAGNGRLDDIKDFVEMNGKHTVHARDDQGWQPIHEAARTGRIETIHFLLEQGADINALTHTGETPTYGTWRRKIKVLIVPWFDIYNPRVVSSVNLVCFLRIFHTNYRSKGWGPKRASPVSR